MPTSTISFLISCQARFAYLLLLLTAWLTACLSISPPSLAPSSLQQSKPSSVQHAFSKTIPFIINMGKERLILPKVDQDKPIILTFFTPNCEPCGIVTRTLNQLKNQEIANDVELYGVCIASRGCIQLREFISTYRPLYPTGYSELSFKAETQMREGPFGPVIAVPITYLVSSNGKLIESFNGSLPLQYVIKLIKQQKINLE